MKRRDVLLGALALQALSALPAVASTETPTLKTIRIHIMYVKQRQWDAIQRAINSLPLIFSDYNLGTINMHAIYLLKRQIEKGLFDNINKPYITLQSKGGILQPNLDWKPNPRIFWATQSIKIKE